MSDVPHEWNFLESAWRFAAVLTGCEEGAAKVFQDSLEELLRHPHAGEPDRAGLLIYPILRRRCLKFPARCELTGFAARLHRQPEPARSALTLLFLDALPAENVQHVLGMNETTLATTLEQVRKDVMHD